MAFWMAPSIGSMHCEIELKESIQRGGFFTPTYSRVGLNISRHRFFPLTPNEQGHPPFFFFNFSIWIIWIFFFKNYPNLLKFTLEIFLKTSPILLNFFFPRNDHKKFHRMFWDHFLGHFYYLSHRSTEVTTMVS